MVSRANDPDVAEDPGRPARSPSRGWWTSLAVGVALLLIYLSNHRDLGTNDTVATTLLPVALVRGDGLVLDRFRPVLRERDGTLPAFVARWHGRLVSRYPVAPAFVILPLVAPQVALLDGIRPGWDRNPYRLLIQCKWMAKWSMGLLMALGAVVFHRFLIRLGLRRGALPAVLAAFLGSDLWTHASQALWQHGPAALALIAALALLHPGPVTRWRLVLAGVATAALFGVRLLDGLFAAAIIAWVARTQPRYLAWFLPAPLLGAAALLGYNLWFFGTITGGQTELEAMHPRLHGVASTWSGSLVAGAAGTLFSPNRGLLIFCPWVAVALAVAAVPAVARRLAAQGPVAWVLAALVPFLLVLSKYAVWWGGHCFGPRYWIDVMPLFALVLAFGLEWMREHSRTLVAITYLTIAFSIGVHAVGTYCYPSTWNMAPANVDLHHERLWDWRDTELSRCLIEKLGSSRR
jgi:hypothetical protein